MRQCDEHRSVQEVGAGVEFAGDVHTPRAKRMRSKLGGARPSA